MIFHNRFHTSAPTSRRLQDEMHNFTVAYLEFEITGANKNISPVFLIDRFLYNVSYKPILSVLINLIKYTYQHTLFFRTKCIKKSIFVKELYCILFCNFQHIFSIGILNFYTNFWSPNSFLLQCNWDATLFATAARDNFSASSKDGTSDFFSTRQNEKNPKNFEKWFRFGRWSAKDLLK